MAGIKRRAVLIVIIVIFIAGFAVLFYPRAAQWYSSRQQDAAIKRYFDEVTGLKDTDVSERLSNAQKYNAMLLDYGCKGDNEFNRNDYSNYSNALSIKGDSIICIVEIPKINVRLPVYSGTADEDLKGRRSYRRYISACRRLRHP